METQYSAARGLIVIVLIVNLLAGALLAVGGLIAIGEFGPIGFFISAGGIVFALVSFAIYEFFKAFLDLVDNSYEIKEHLIDTNKLLSEKG